MIDARKITDEKRLELIQRSLEDLQHLLATEISSKQKFFERQEQEILRLTRSVDDKNKLIEDSKKQLEKCARETEGGRQLINKLLNDVERLHQDIDWYKRTYEERSFLGMLKERFKGKSRKK